MSALRERTAAILSGGGVTTRIRHGIVGSACILLVGGVLAATSGVTGIVLGSVVVITALLATPVFAFSITTVGLLAVGTIDPVVHALGVLAAIGVLASGTVEYPTGWETLTMSVAVGIVLTGLTGALLIEGSVLAATVGVSLSVTGIVYVLHRYEQVTLGLVSEVPQ